jgi:hypothetical protein
VAYKIEPRKLTLVLDDYDGAEVVCRLSISLGEMLDMQAAATADASGIRESYERFGREVLISWSVEGEDGEPLPANAEGMMRLTPDMASAIMGAWGQQIVAVPPKPPAQ